MTDHTPPRRLIGQMLLTNELGHPLLVTSGATGRRQLPGGTALRRETALWTAAYHVRRQLGIHRDPGPVLTIDHTDPEPSSPGDAESLTVVVHGGSLRTAQTACITLPQGGDTEILAWGFVDPARWPDSVDAQQQRCIEAALTALDTGCPYLRNGRRLSSYAVTA
ncbi:hypothetical protein I5Q34_18020 [Streptomyces sp. AV19]|uniref:hypothetical protein n=1 Tax=Streptomyces sp. AV19 TaxID=2793068 RepID=UPI0018FE8D26|nr:hypothetical protein [Streptomyces sp. AV19]MBH1936144.1 hypothetical protein [Streptomyces sp. AV19]MDG4534060.1 hypothetical protein [Streptomyces sp. AV19]